MSFDRLKSAELNYIYTGKKSKNSMKFSLILFSLLLSVCLPGTPLQAQKKPEFSVIAFFTAKNDKAHISYVHEANKWFAALAEKKNFIYDTTKNWNNLNSEFLSKYQVVVFLDTRPEVEAQRDAFRKYIEAGGSWMGFHFAAFSLTPSSFPQNWDWYHNDFLGSGEYKGNTWRPTSAILGTQGIKHPATRSVKKTFVASPNEWYSWKNDLRKNPDIKVLLSIDSSSFPLGTGPKPHEIWHNGYYPVVWTNIKYKMIYINMGHNDIDYENKTNRELSFTFKNKAQNKIVTDALFWLGK